jgi:hypothetical protein
LNKLSAVRKSGLTFAVETPLEACQRSLNKEVSRDDVVAILLEAKKHGWRTAKFYFMIGLPLVDAEKGEEGGEADEIVSFVLDIARRTRMHFSVNVGTFIPKPHTPFQWAKQCGEEASRRQLEYIRNQLRACGHKVGIQDPFVSLLEGVISRGDERVAMLIEKAFQRGCRLDAWNEHIKKDIWRSLFEEHAGLVTEILSEKESNAPLPWQDIVSGTTEHYLWHELSKAASREVTPVCIEKCIHPCGVCNDEQKIVRNNRQYDETIEGEQPELTARKDGPFSIEGAPPAAR